MPTVRKYQRSSTIINSPAKITLDYIGLGTQLSLILTVEGSQATRSGKPLIMATVESAWLTRNLNSMEHLLYRALKAVGIEPVEFSITPLANNKFTIFFDRS